MAQQNAFAVRSPVRETSPPSPWYEANNPTMIYAFGEFELDEERFELRQRGETVAVQPKVLGLLFVLVREHERAVAKQELLEANWGDVVVGEASLARAIMEARRAIGDDAHEMIVTVRGRGFRFAAPVEARTTRAPRAPAAAKSETTAFVGRDVCVAALRVRLDEAIAGRGSVAFVVGEAGIGKTRVVEELARIARATGARVDVGRSTQDAGAPAYWPWTQIARAHGIAMHFTSAPADQPEFATFDAFARALVASSVAAPLVLVVEDIHLADAGSLRALQFLARETSGARILVVATYREGLVVDEARATLLGAVLRASGGFTISLRGLTRDDVERLLESTTGQAPPTELVVRLHDKSGGNPLYLQQLLATDWADRVARAPAQATSLSTDLHHGLRESIARHLDGVSPACQDALTTAATLGQKFDFAMLATTSQLKHEELLDRLDEAQRARVLSKTNDGSYRFRHPLVRDVLYRSVSGAQRAARHATIAALLDAHWGAAASAHAAELAYHYVKALPGGDARRALALAIEAAEQSTACGAHAEAATHGERALEALSHLRDEEPRRLAVQLELGRARKRAGDARRARDAFLDAVMLASASHDADALRDATLELTSVEPGANQAAPSTSPPTRSK